MDMIGIRRQMMGIIAAGGGNVANYVTGTFKPDTDETVKIIDFGVPITNISAVILHIEGIETLSDVPNATQLDIYTVLDPVYALNSYAAVVPYYSAGLAKNASGTMVSCLYSRSSYSVGPTYQETTKFTFRPYAANIYFRANYTYRWTAYLN